MRGLPAADPHRLLTGASGQPCADTARRTGGGNALPTAVVTAVHPDGTHAASSHVGPGGWYLLELPGEHDYYVVAAAPGHDPDAVAVTVDGTALRYDFELPAAAHPVTHTFGSDTKPRTTPTP